jgi:hypothetical protein
MESVVSDQGLAELPPRFSRLGSLRGVERLDVRQRELNVGGKVLVQELVGVGNSGCGFLVRETDHENDQQSHHPISLVTHIQVAQTMAVGSSSVAGVQR